MHSQRPSMLSTFSELSSYSVRPSAMPTFRPSSLRPSAMSATITLVPTGGSISPSYATYLTLPPQVAAAQVHARHEARRLALRGGRRLPRLESSDYVVHVDAIAGSDVRWHGGAYASTELDVPAVARRSDAVHEEPGGRLTARAPARSARELGADSALYLACCASQRDGVACARHGIEVIEPGLETRLDANLRAQIERSHGQIFFVALDLGGLHTQDGVSYRVADPMAETVAPVAPAETRAQFAARIEGLPRRMRQILVGLYVERMTLEEVGRALGLTAWHACHVHAEALRMLAAPVPDRGQECSRRAGSESEPASCRSSERAEREPLYSDLPVLASLTA